MAEQGKGVPTGPGLRTLRLRVADRDVVWLRSILEGYDGLALVFGDGSGVVTLVTPDDRAAELDGLIDDLARETPVQRLEPPD